MKNAPIFEYNKQNIIYHVMIERNGIQKCQQIWTEYVLHYKVVKEYRRRRWLDFLYKYLYKQPNRMIFNGT